MDKDEEDFMRDATGEIIAFQNKLARKAFIGFALAILFLSGLIALLSTTVALWVVTILGGIWAIYLALFLYGKRRFKKAVEQEIKNPTPFEDMFKL